MSEFKVVSCKAVYGMRRPVPCHGCDGEFPVGQTDREWHLSVRVHDGRRLATLTFCQRCAWFLDQLTQARWSPRDYEKGRLKWRLVPNQLRNMYMEYMADVRQDIREGHVKQDIVPIAVEVDMDGRLTGRARIMEVKA
jgi:hypothetical protein